MVIPNVSEGTPFKIALNEVTKIYTTRTGPLLALDRFSAEIGEGEFVCVVGPSGCGKTTLLWAMTGLHPVTSGVILMAGQPVTGPRPEIGIVFQEANLLPWRTVQKNIEFPFEIRRIPASAHRSEIQSLLDLVGLSGFSSKYPRELSGGMQQRVSIVRALAQNPSVLLMDEPFGALDAFTRDEMNLLLLKTWSSNRKTIVFVTHSIPEAVFLGDRIFAMSPRPGRLAKEFRVSLPRPRTIDMMFAPEFTGLVQEIRASISQGTPTGEMVINGNPQG